MSEQQERRNYEPPRSVDLSGKSVTGLQPLGFCVTGDKPYEQCATGAAPTGGTNPPCTTGAVADYPACSGGSRASITCVDGAAAP